MCLIILTLVSCAHAPNKTSNIDPFYTEKGEWDSARLPFIKPYEAVIVNKEFGWFMNLKGFDGDTGFPNIKKANVINGVILLYSTNSILHGIDAKQSWHVIIPGKNIEKGFGSHQEYLNYLNTLRIRVDPRLYNIESIAKYYENHDTIAWKSID